jgi:LDH2 family malate/lactate/ureidoglycolate dehydrogenase
MIAAMIHEPQALAALVGRLLVAAGTLPANAAAVGEHLVDCELRGLPSHGLLRVPPYLDYIASGYILPGGRVKHRWEGPLLRVDGGGGFGVPAMNRAVEELSKRGGLGIAAVTGVAHTGRIGRFAEELAEQGFLAWILGGGYFKRAGGQVAPYGGRQAIYSTNPHAFAFPGGRYGPMVADFASSAVASGKVAVARDKGEPLPAGSIIDKHGRPTRDARDYFDGGALLPAAGPKGYGLALMAELVGYALLGNPREFNWLIVALPVGLFRDPAEVTAAAEEVLAAMKAVPPAEGFDEVSVPGERQRQRKARATGVEVAPYMAERLRACAEKLGVSAEPF